MVEMQFLFLFIYYNTFLKMCKLHLKKKGGKTIVLYMNLHVHILLTFKKKKTFLHQISHNILPVEVHK